MKDLLSWTTPLYELEHTTLNCTTWHPLPEGEGERPSHDKVVCGRVVRLQGIRTTIVSYQDIRRIKILKKPRKVTGVKPSTSQS